MKKAFVFLSLLISSTAQACNDYDDCMSRARDMQSSPGYSQTYAQMAIAYKLDDIKKELKTEKE